MQSLSMPLFYFPWEFNNLLEYHLFTYLFCFISFPLEKDVSFHVGRVFVCFPVALEHVSAWLVLGLVTKAFIIST